jgi:hypothetical protein
VGRVIGFERLLTVSFYAEGDGFQLLVGLGWLGRDGIEARRGRTFCYDSFLGIGQSGAFGLFWPFGNSTWDFWIWAGRWAVYELERFLG